MTHDTPPVLSAVYYISQCYMTHDTPPVLSAVLLHITGVASNSYDTDTEDTDEAFMQ